MNLDYVQQGAIPVGGIAAPPATRPAGFIQINFERAMTALDTLNGASGRLADLGFYSAEPPTNSDGRRAEADTPSNALADVMCRLIQKANELNAQVSQLG